MNLLAVHLISWRPSNSESRIITKALKRVEQYTNYVMKAFVIVG